MSRHSSHDHSRDMTKARQLKGNEAITSLSLASYGWKEVV